MRVTQSMLTGNMLRNLSQSYQRMGKYQDQLSTGKRITKPSDDPVVAMKGMEYRTDLTEVEQFKRNLSEVNSWMENSDAALDEAGQVLHRVRELTVQASNGTYEDSQRGAIADEIGQLRDHLINIANTKVAGKYIFNGTDTTNAPVNADGIVVRPNGTEAIKIEVSKGIKLKVNIDEDKAFSQDLFDDLQGLVDELNNAGSSGEQLNAFIGKVDSHLDEVVSERAELGARYNRVEMVQDRVAEQEVIANRILSDNEDADMERVIIDLKTQESVHRAALAAGARIIQPTLMDFLR
ncbi:flagellar hook-associated protein FlgL [Pseudalkalibacillus berkeleyi]|uniref:Flagellar hook-associated protein FlgL n=1 Tax=Pseudalkalibacillus berkeleyi TaxID=1069813 RepID=A0ABS9H4A7_9BACL|nr:flagellar hook-associated protein FlgL [Pseudalkalibacillus berkeleyi]MCF6138756.1 flagellar hook-associated protein FlgL [Pseudalkalibacillus berkeleyi]